MGKIIENYSLQEVIGEGVYAKVYKAIHLLTKQQVAIKVVQVNKFHEIPKLEECTINEINILASINRECEHIVKYIDMLQSPNNYYFVYQFCNGGTLEKVMQREGQLPQRKALLFTKQIFQAFKILSKHNIMHRDLKPDNILLHNGTIKLADFGFCKTLQDKNGLTQTMLGSPIYMAPEVLKGQPYTMKADIWSMGVVLYQMLYGRYPFESKTIAQLLKQFETMNACIPAHPRISKLTQQLLKRMLVKEPTKRISWQDIFNTYVINDAGEILNKFQLRSSLKGTFSYSSQLKRQFSHATTFKVNNVTQKINKSYQITNIDDSIPIMARKSPLKHKNSDTLVKADYNSTTSVSTQSVSFHSTKTDRSGRFQMLVKNHSKSVQINQMIIDTNNLQQAYSTYVSYLLFKGIEKDTLHLYETLKKEVTNEMNIYKSENYENFKEFKTMVGKQHQTLKLMNSQFLKELEEEEKETRLLGGRVEQAQKQKNKIMKVYIQNLKETDQDLRLASQIVDYLQQSILIKRDAYQRMSRDHLCRQIRNKLSKF